MPVLAPLFWLLTPLAPAPSPKDPFSLPSNSATRNLRPFIHCLSFLHPSPAPPSEPKVPGKGPTHVLCLCLSLLPCSGDSYQRAGETSGTTAWKLGREKNDTPKPAMLCEPTCEKPRPPHRSRLLQGAREAPHPLRDLPRQAPPTERGRST